MIIISKEQLDYMKKTIKEIVEAYFNNLSLRTTQIKDRVSTNLKKLKIGIIEPTINRIVSKILDEELIRMKRDFQETASTIINVFTGELKQVRS